MRAARWCLAVSLLCWASIVSAQCVPATCMMMDTHSICSTTTWSCQLVIMSATECLPATTSEPPVGTPCESDMNECTTDACGGAADMGSLGNGVCEHTSVADGTPCAEARGSCAAGACVCGGGFKACNGDCIATSACCTDEDCTTTALCLVAPTCVMNVCTGTPKSCTPSATCRVSTCDPSSGACEESTATVGASCDPTNVCQQSGTCDATGACNGDPAPDGTPCTSASCSGAVCANGTCGCDLVGSASDMASTPASRPGGCNMAAATAPSLLGLLLVAAVAIIDRRRRVRT